MQGIPRDSWKFEATGERSCFNLEGEGAKWGGIFGVKHFFSYKAETLVLMAWNAYFIMLLVYKFVAFGIFMEFKCVNALVLIVNVSSTQEGELQTAAFYATLTYAENKNHF